MKIGQLAQATQTTTPTIRYYEEIGLLPVPPRQEGSHRVYGEADVQRLTFIRRCRDFGFPIEKVRLLASLMQDGDRPCADARVIAFEHLTQIRVKLADLRELEQSMASFVENCDRTCADGTGSDCVIFEELKGVRSPAAASCCARAMK